MRDRIEKEMTAIPRKTRKRKSSADKGEASDYVEDDPDAWDSSSTLMVRVLPFLQFGFDSRGSVSL